VHEPQLAQPRLICRLHVLLHDGRDVARGEGVEVQLPLDWNLVSHCLIRPVAR
jgi:hypothetical protein